MSQSVGHNSVITTTYNQPRDLALHLTSLIQQTSKAFDILVADDGSTDETRAVIEKFQREGFGNRIKHIWHPDVGYRKAKIVNEAIRNTTAEWLIFLDADTVLHPRFVEDHLSQKKRNRLFMGRRVDLAPEVSLWLRNHFDKFLSAEFFLRAVTSENSNRGIRISNEFAARTLGAFRVPSLLGLNFSIDRELLEKINGFDESNTHYWGEDGDLFARCVHVGAEIIGRKMFAVQYHLWHERRHPKPDAYQQYLNRLNDASYVYCEQGLKDSVTSVLK